MLSARVSLVQRLAVPTHARALSALQAPKEAVPTAAQGGKKAKPAKIKTFKIWRYDPEQKNQKPYSVD